MPSSAWYRLPGSREAFVTCPKIRAAVRCSGATQVHMNSSGGASAAPVSGKGKGERGVPAFLPRMFGSVCRAMQMQRFRSLRCAAVPSLRYTARCATSLSTYAATAAGVSACNTLALRRGFSTDATLAQQQAAARVAERRQKQQPSSSEGTAATSAWPPGMLSNNGAAEPTVIPPDFANELVYEVGWQTLHTFIDVRSDASAPLAARAVRVPLNEGGADFVRRLKEALDEPSLESRVVLADLDGAEGGAAYEAAIDLQEAGFVNAVVVRGGMKEWQEEGFAMEEGEEEVEDWP